MATTNQIKKYSQLDFDTAREELVDYLRSQTEFADFDFEGSAMTLLVDALTYTTTKLGLYANMSLSECFLDSAQLRSSVVSHAKSLGYIPRSMNSAYAEIELSIALGVGETGRTDFYVDRGTKFTSQIGQTSFNFVTLDRHQFIEDGVGTGDYTAAVRIYEGILTTQFYEYAVDVGSPVFRISSLEVDRNWITIRTKPDSESSTITEWAEAENIVGYDNEDNVYFIQEGLDGHWEFYFGDDVIGVEPQVGDWIECEYLYTKGSLANGVKVFDLIDSIDGELSGSFNITLVEAAGYGSPIESTDSIKSIAPRFYRTQNRAVTADDYTALILANYGFVQTMGVWGGETNVPPKFGKVMICIKPRYGDYLSTLTKESIKAEILDKYAVVGITPEIVDPDITFIYVDSEVFFRKERTTLSDGDLSSLVQDNIEDFFTNYVSFFDGVFRYSKFLATVDDVDPSIEGNKTTYQIAKIFKPQSNVSTQYLFNFLNSIVPLSFKSAAFTSTGGQSNILKDDGLGNVDHYSEGVLIRKNIGTIDYTTGVINIVSFSFDVPTNTEIIFKARPVDYDLYSVRNNLIVLRNVDVTMTRLGS